MSDPCECFFDHEAAMQRLLSLLRGSQTVCTDSDCLTDGLPNVGGADTLVLWTLLWSVLAMGLYFMRPNSMRSGANRNGNDAVAEKASTSSSNDNNQPPPPPPPSAM